MWLFDEGGRSTELNCPLRAAIKKVRSPLAEDDFHHVKSGRSVISGTN